MRGIIKTLSSQQIFGWNFFAAIIALVSFTSPVGAAENTPPTKMPLVYNVRVPEDQRLSLAGEWQVALGLGDQALRYTNTAKLPGTLDENRLGTKTSDVNLKELNRRYKYTGPASYQRKISAPAAWSGRRIYLNLERTKVTRVWVDGRLVGTQASLTTPQVYDLTDFFIAGREHTLTIEVNNDKELLPQAMRMGWVTQTSDTTQTDWNGILGNIELIARLPVHVSKVLARPDVDRKETMLLITIENSTGKPVAGSLKFRAQAWKAGKKIKKSLVTKSANYAVTYRTETIQVVLPMGNQVELWDEFSPSLYRLNTELTVNGEHVADVTSIQFGMRKFGVAPDKRHIQINGRTIEVRGEVNNAFFPLTGYTPTELEPWLRLFRRYQEFGLNNVRFHSYTPPQAAFDAADQLGLYLQVELPQWGQGFRNASEIEYFQMDGLKTLAQYGNSPAFMFYSLGNEVVVDDRKKFADMMNFYRAADPTRYYSAGSWAGLEILPKGGWVAFQPKTGDDFWYSGATEKGNFQLPLNNNTTWDGNRFLTEATLPYITHELGMYNVFPDYAAELPKYTGVMEPRNLRAYADLLDHKHMLWQAHDFQRASAALAQLLYRRNAEDWFRTTSVAGWHYLGMQDFPGQGTALVGLMDVFCDFKPGVSPAVFRESCAPVVVMGCFDKYVWKSDETFRSDIKIANFGASTLEAARVVWRLKGSSGKTICQGEVQAGRIPQGGLFKAGEIQVPLGAISEAQQVTLELALEGTPVRNHYDLWVYPASIDTKIPAGVLVAPAMTAAAEQALAAGGKVLIFPRLDAASLPNQMQVGFRASAWWGDGTMGLLIQNEHPALARFPTSFHTDFQWWNPINHCRGVVLDQAPAEFLPIIQVIPSYKEPKKAGLLFEASVGAGRLMVCAIDLEKAEGIEEKQLLHSLLRYMDSPQFKPTQALSVELLRTLLPAAKDNSTSTTRLGCKVIDGLLVGQIVKFEASSTGQGFRAIDAVDGRADTVWCSQYIEGHPDYGLPVNLTFTLDREYRLNQLTYLPGGSSRAATEYEVAVSQDGNAFQRVATGKWPADGSEKRVEFSPVKARYLKFTILKGTGENPVVEAREIGLGCQPD